MKNTAVLLSSLVLLLSSCSTGNNDKTTTIQDTSFDTSVVEDSNLTPEQAEENAKTSAIENRATYTEALSSADASMCEKIESYDLQFSCRQNATFQLAIQNKDKSICAKLETSKGQNNCEEAVDSL